MKKIKDKEELKAFLLKVGYFHDGVINNVTYNSGSFGDKSGISPFDCKAEIKIKIQGCACGEIELKFSHVIKAMIVPTPLEYTSEIFQANIQIINNKFIFISDVDDLNADIKLSNSKTFVVSNELAYSIK